MSDTIRSIGSQMATMMYNLSQGANLPAETHDLMRDMHQRWDAAVSADKAPPPQRHVMGDGEASIIECLAAGKPFVFDPATNFLHADDGTVEGGIRYMPVPAHHTGRLLPCPFCGGEPEFQESNPYDQSDDVAFTVFCRECGTEHPWRSTPEDAVAFWNRRAALASAEVENG